MGPIARWEGAASLAAMARLVGNLRYLVIVAVVGIALQASRHLRLGCRRSPSTSSYDLLSSAAAWQQDDTVVELLQVLDLYLIGTVLLITASGSTSCSSATCRLPGWLVIRNLSDLKTKIVEVIVLVIGIKFVEKLVTVKEPIDVLWYGLGSAAVMAVLIGWNSLKSAK